MSRKINPITWFEIYVSDLKRAKSFYEAVFGYDLVEEKTDGSFSVYRFPGGMPASGAIGALVKHPLRQPSESGTLVYFHCDDCGLTSELVISNGGAIFRPKLSVGEDGFIAIVGDTEGNAIGLHSFK
jgi:predicted enzyme related to lactoylglutathione lyase